MVWTLYPCGLLKSSAPLKEGYSEEVIQRLGRNLNTQTRWIIVMSSQCFHFRWKRAFSTKKWLEVAQIIRGHNLSSSPAAPEHRNTSTTSMVAVPTAGAGDAAVIGWIGCRRYGQGGYILLGPLSATLFAEKQVWPLYVHWYNLVCYFCREELQTVLFSAHGWNTGTTWPGVCEEGGIHDLRKAMLGSSSGKVRQQEEEKKNWK